MSSTDTENMKHRVRDQLCTGDSALGRMAHHPFAANLQPGHPTIRFGLVEATACQNMLQMATSSP